MISSQAKREFEIRYYHWATSEFRHEIDCSFKNLNLFKTPSVWGVQRFMESLGKQDQLLLASAMLKRFHPEAVKTLNENCSSEEQFLRDKLDDFRRNRDSDAELDVAARKGAGEKVKFVSKRKLLTIAAQTFQQAFAKCQETDRDLDYDPRLGFEMRIDGWVIYTNFWFGRQSPLLNYQHGIATERVFEQSGTNGPYQAPFPIGIMMSFCSWLGICSQTEWEYLENKDVPIACDELVKHCANFFEVAPKLLKGLEIDSIG